MEKTNLYKTKIQQLINQEFFRANEKFPRHNSAHESYAIALEEFEELLEEVDSIKERMDFLWVAVKNNNQGSKQEDIIKELTEINVKLINEAIQFSAMIERFNNDILLPF